MIDCALARDEMLDAAPDELGGVARTELASHVRSCPRCAPLARLLLDEQARLGGAIALLQPRLSADAAASEVLAAQTLPARMRESRRERLGRIAATLFPMAAAAALAAWFVYGDREPVPYPVGTFVQAPARVVRITAQPGTSTIVLTTGDPDITFAWIGKEIVP